MLRTDQAEELFRIAVGLGSISIVAAASRRPSVKLSGALWVFGTQLMISGCFLLVQLPSE